ncbi:acylphosphatase [Oceanobacillus limi]|uniref:Acylphosphatase n=1 Tax=Oceanobacillus limi TaxID=930131 RepID=A0A1H9ZBL4_9BACI|nr:acylphosphatase [Oceanobacillus limi]SES79014.1 acylphosphatase [Oceanobacillus limi]
MRIHGIIHGRVQGVGFRFSAKQYAVKHNLCGWVKNKLDGTVEIEVEGKKSEMDSFLSELKRGFHPAIKVTDMILTPLDKEVGYQEFHIKH